MERGFLPNFNGMTLPSFERAKFPYWWTDAPLLGILCLLPSPYEVPNIFYFFKLVNNKCLHIHRSRENIISFLALSPNFHNYHLACVTYPIFTIKWKSPLKYLVIHLSDICYVPMSKLLFFFDIHLVGNTLMHLRCKHHGALEALAISSDLPFSQRWVSWLNSSLNSI